MKSIDIEYNQKRSQHRKYGRIQECFYCGKNKKCIQSHSISQSHCLNQLSEEINKQKGVYGFDSITWNWSNWYDGNIIPGEFKLVGTNIASTFTGFAIMTIEQFFLSLTTMILTIILLSNVSYIATELLLEDIIRKERI